MPTLHLAVVPLVCETVLCEFKPEATWQLLPALTGLPTETPRFSIVLWLRSLIHIVCRLRGRSKAWLIMLEAYCIMTTGHFGEETVIYRDLSQAAQMDASNTGFKLHLPLSRDSFQGWPSILL